ncbi:MAG: hypothetical protein F6K21_04555 [Symploca sp. SIO2D2]|nr:hypothetical protein [Symploca sp. SIO2D2]
MRKSELIQQLENHPNFDVDRLYEIAQGRQLTKAVLWEYLCELTAWKPLEVVQSTSPNWYLVASSSETGLWYKVNIISQVCDCIYSEYRTTPCCHLSAAMAHQENQWIERAAKYGLTVSVVDGKYQVQDKMTGSCVGEIWFDEDEQLWFLTEPRKPGILRYEGVDEVIEYLSAVVSFGSQLA